MDAMTKGTHRIISWWDDACEVSVKVNTPASQPETVLAVALSSNAARSEYLDRKREAAEDPAEDPAENDAEAKPATEDE